MAEHVAEHHAADPCSLRRRGKRAQHRDRLERRRRRIDPRPRLLEHEVIGHGQVTKPTLVRHLRQVAKSVDGHAPELESEFHDGVLGEAVGPVQPRGNAPKHWYAGSETAVDGVALREPDDLDHTGSVVHDVDCPVVAHTEPHQSPGTFEHLGARRPRVLLHAVDEARNATLDIAR